MLHKMMRRFGASNENTKELRGDLVNIGIKVDAHAVSFKHLELQTSQFSTIVNRENQTLLLAIPSKILKMMDTA